MVDSFVSLHEALGSTSSGTRDWGCPSNSVSGDTEEWRPTQANGYEGLGGKLRYMVGTSRAPDIYGFTSVSFWTLISVGGNRTPSRGV